MVAFVLGLFLRGEIAAIACKIAEPVGIMANVSITSALLRQLLQQRAQPLQQ